MGIGSTFKLVCRATKGVINHVTVAPNEKDSDEIHVRETKREAWARTLQQRWLSTYFMGATIDIVKFR